MPSEVFTPGPQTIAAAVSLARRAACCAPFVWITEGDEPRVRGLPTHAEAADGGAAYVSWHWDGHRLTVESDVLGLVPAFVYCSGREIAISTSIAKLVHEGATLHVDRTALAVFLRLGFFIGDDTPFVEIRALPPGARMVWDKGRLSASGGPYVVRRANPSRDEAIDAAITLTARAIERRQPRQAFALPLSAGRDSRHMLLALDVAGHRPAFAVTVPRFPPAPPEDPRIASEVAAATGVRHVLVPQTAAPAAAEARKNIATSYCADEHAWFFPMLDYLKDRVPLVYEGIGGSLWTVGWMPQREVRELWHSGRTHEVATRMMRRYTLTGERFLQDLFPETAVCDHARAVERLARELERHASAPDPGKSFHFWNRLRRELTLVPFGQIRQFAEVHTPLVDRHLTDFLLSLDPEVISPGLTRADKSFHSDAVRRAFPRMAHLPFESDDAPQTDTRAHATALTVMVARFLMGRGGRSRLMRSTYVWPRAAYTLLNSRYAQSTSWFATTALYVAQLEDAAA